MDHRENVILEIIATEKNYVQKLLIVQEYIIKTLQSSGTLDPDDIKGQVRYIALSLVKVTNFYLIDSLDSGKHYMYYMMRFINVW